MTGCLWERQGPDYAEDRVSIVKTAIQPSLAGRRMVINGDIDPALDIPRGERILIISQDQSFLTHGFHKYPAKFFPELPRWLVRKHATRGPVLDPMTGSGTVNVVGLRTAESWSSERWLMREY